MTNKRGRASNKEIDFVRLNCDTKTDEEIGKILGRSVPFVTKLRAQLPAKLKPEEQHEALARLHGSHFWPITQRQLVGTEVRYFEQSWIQLTEQFSQHGILFTDEMGMRDLIMHDISANRAQHKKAKNIVDIDEFERLLSIEMEVDFEARDIASVAQWETQRAALIASQHALTREHMDYQEKKDKKLVELKATRDGRLKHAEQSTHNFWEMMRSMNTPAKRKEWSQYMQKMHLAGEIVRLEWSQTIQFEDGKFDKPFISPEGELADKEFADESE